jgi:hypothetical protein
VRAYLLKEDFQQLWVRWTPSVGQESGGAKRESHRVPTPLPIRGEV